MKKLFTIISLAFCTTMFAQKVDTIKVEKQLTKGWNLIAYPHSTAGKMDSVLSSIWSKVEVIKDADSVFSKKNSPTALNTLSRLQPASGYWIKVSENCTLTWKIAQVDTKCCKALIQNSFNPGNADPILAIFKPKFSDCCVVSEYSLKIVDRFGMQLFETTDPSASWDGKVNGVTQKEDVYLFFLSYRNGLGVLSNVKGNMILLLNK